MSPLVGTIRGSLNKASTGLRAQNPFYCYNNNGYWVVVFHRYLWGISYPPLFPKAEYLFVFTPKPIIIKEAALIKKKHQVIGFPRMLHEAGEKRVFLPEFIEKLIELGFEVCIEEGYGSRSGFSKGDYIQGNPGVRVRSREECFAQEMVLILRSPKIEDYNLIPPGTCLISMLHYPTRPNRLKLLREHGIHAISLDGIVDDNDVRLVENMKAVAWNGLEAAYDVLEKRFARLSHPDGRPWQVLVLGSGMVGKHAVDAAIKLGNIERYNTCLAEGTGQAMVRIVGRSMSEDPQMMRELFKDTDILVDATYRRNPSKPVVPNDWIAWLPDHTVLVDLAVDPYTLNANPPVVRGIEGIPQGNLDQYIFHPDDPHWCDAIPESISTTERRTAVTCYSWPGIHPEACMHHYARQLLPLMEVLSETGYEDLSPQGNYFQRALYRATLRGYLQAIAED
jgi:alanine dehydrogenase